MPIRPVCGPRSRAPALPAHDPLTVLRNPAAPHFRTIGVWCEAENRIYPVRAVIDASVRSSAISETLVERLNLRFFVTPPSMPPGDYAVVPVMEAMESCGIPDMRFDVRVARWWGEEEILLGENALEKAAWKRVG